MMLKYRMKYHEQVGLQTNCNNSYGLEQIELLKRLPPLHKIHRSLRHFANLSEINCQRYGLLRLRDGNRNSDTKLNQLTKDWTKIEERQTSKSTDFALSLTRLNENRPESEIRRSYLDPMHGLDRLLCALDERALQVERMSLAEKNTDQNRIFGKLNLERIGEDKDSLVRRRQLQRGSSMNNLWSKPSVTDVEAACNFRSPRTCVDCTNSSEEKQKMEQISDLKIEPKRRPRLIPPAVVCPTKYETVGLQLSPGTLQDPKKLGETYDRLLKQLHCASLHDLQEAENKKAKNLKAPPCGSTNVSNLIFSRERLRINRSDSVSSGSGGGGGAGVVPVMVRRALGAPRERRQSLYALHQLRMAAQKRMNEEWEEDLSRSSGARKLKIVFIAVKFLNIVIQRYRLSHRLTNPSFSGALRGSVRSESFDSPLEADYMCPLLQATVSSYPYFGSQQQRAGADAVTIIDDLIAPPPEIPTYLASLQIGEKRVDIIEKNKPASEKGGKKAASKQKKTNVVAKRRTSVGGIPIRRSGRSSRNKLVNTQLEFNDPVMKAARIKRRLQQIIITVTDNYVKGVRFQEILSLGLTRILADNIRDQCRDLLRISHSCKECHCRDDDIGNLPLEKVRDPASFTVVVMTHVVEKKNQSVMIASRCFREAPMDDYLTYTHEDFAYAVIIVVYLFRKYFTYKKDPRRFEVNPGLNTLYKYWLNDKISWVERHASMNETDEISADCSV